MRLQDMCLSNYRDPTRYTLLKSFDNTPVDMDQPLEAQGVTAGHFLKAIPFVSSP
jgi:hypothetical protein